MSSFSSTSASSSFTSSSPNSSSVSSTTSQTSTSTDSSSSSSTDCVPDAAEDAAWKNVKDIAVPCINFWVNWLRVIQNKNPCPDLLTCIVRAVSWVESKHGTFDGPNHGARDPMQVGNPADIAWKNIGINPSNLQADRPVREAALPGMSWKDIPGNVDSIINPIPPPNPPVLPFQIDPTFHPVDGHDNANFTQQMSYFWGVIWYFYSIQTAAAPASAWKLGKCVPANLIKGAVMYNGGGDTNYETKIKSALGLSCCAKNFNL